MIALRTVELENGTRYANKKTPAMIAKIRNSRFNSRHLLSSEFRQSVQHLGQVRMRNPPHHAYAFLTGYNKARSLKDGEVSGNDGWVHAKLGGEFASASLPVREQPKHPFA